jgi:hypothetical protein
MNEFLYGSICLSDVPRELFKKVTTKSGETKVYLNIGVGRSRSPLTVTDDATGNVRTLTHYVTCRPPKDECKEGVNYFIGDLQTYTPPTASVSAAPIAEPTDLPF